LRWWGIRNLSSIFGLTKLDDTVIPSKTHYIKTAVGGWCFYLLNVSIKMFVEKPPSLSQFHLQNNFNFSTIKFQHLFNSPHSDSITTFIYFFAISPENLH
jgi:hypothetical protein